DGSWRARPTRRRPRHLSTTLAALTRHSREGAGLRALPLAHAAGVHVHEVGAGVVANATGAHGQGRAVQVRQVDTLDADVDGLAQHVLAARGDLVAALVQHGVGLRRTVAGDDLEAARRLQLAVD